MTRVTIYHPRARLSSFTDPTDCGLWLKPCTTWNLQSLQLNWINDQHSTGFSRQISATNSMGDPPSLRCLALASGESCSSTVSFWPFFSFLSFFDLKFAAAKLEHFKHWKTFWNNMCWKWHLYLHPRQCLIWMEAHILAQYLYETMKRDTYKMVHLPFVPKQWTNKTSICECLSQYGLEVKTSSPPCRRNRCGWIEV